MERSQHKRTTIHSLLAIDNIELVKRYLRKSRRVQEKLIDAFNDVINIRDFESNNFKYGAVACLNGACLDYIYAEVFEKINSIVTDAGFEFRIENIVSDLNRVLNDNAVTVLQARKDTEHVAPAIKKIVQDYVNNVLTDKVLVTALGSDIAHLL